MTQPVVGRIVAITVTYNPGVDLAPFLDSVRAQTHADLHLVIVDNDSSDGTRETLCALRDPAITVILNDANRGVAAANNQGIDCALAGGADAVLLINNDTVFGPDLVDRLAARLAFPAAAAVTPVIPYFDDPGRIWYAGGRFVRWPGLLNVHEHADGPLARVGPEPFATTYAPTCCLMVDRRVFDAIGRMDEQYFVYWDDTDFCWRMRGAGLGLLVDPGAVLLHKVSRSTGGALSPFTIRHSQRNQMLFVRKHCGPGLIAYTAAASAGLALFGLLRGRTTVSQTGLRLRALIEGLRMPVTAAGALGDGRACGS